MLVCMSIYLPVYVRVSIMCQNIYVDIINTTFCSQIISIIVLMLTQTLIELTFV